MMLNGVIAALVAITAACAFVSPWAAIVIGFVAGGIVVVGVLLVEKAGIDDPIGALAAHGMAGVWGTIVARLPDACPSRRRRSRPARRAPLRRRLSTSSASRLSASSPSARSRSPPRSACSVADEGDRRHPHRARGRVGRARRVRARHVGLSRVLHPGPGRLWHRGARPPRPVARPRAHGSCSGRACCCARACVRASRRSFEGVALRGALRGSSARRARSRAAACQSRAARPLALSPCGAGGARGGPAAPSSTPRSATTSCVLRRSGSRRRIQHVELAACHARADIEPDVAEHDDGAAGHVLAGMVAGAFDDGDGA